MYLIKKMSKGGKIYFVLVVKSGFMVEGKFKKDYVNLTYSKGLEFADTYHINIYESEEK